MKGLRLAAAAVAVAMACVPPVAPQQGATYRPAITSGSGASETTGNFGTFSVPSINSKGKLVFVGGLTGSGVTTSNDTAVYAAGPEFSLNLIAREGDSANQEVGVLFGSLSSALPVMNTDGLVAFQNDLTGPGIVVGEEEGQNSQSLWLWPGGANPPDLLARANNAAPVTPSADYYGLGQPLLNNQAHAAFQAQLGTSTLSTDFAIFANVSGTVTKVARAGDTEPGGGGQAYTTFGNPVVNPSQKVAFGAQLTGFATVAFFDGIYFGDSSSLAKVARQGDAAPGTALSFIGFSDPVINNDGSVAFRGQVTGGTLGIWLGPAAGPLTKIAQTGEAAPGGGNFTSVANPVLGGDNRIAFAANISGLGSTIWTATTDSGSLKRLAAAGDTALGTGGTMTYTALFNPVVNGSGQTMFSANLSGGGSNSGIFATDPFGADPAQNIVKVVRVGDVLPTGPSQTGILAGFTVQTNSGGEDGRATGFNDAGQLAFHASFTNGSTAVMVARVGGAARLEDNAPVRGPGAVYAAGPTVTIEKSGPNPGDDYVPEIVPVTSDIGYVRFTGLDGVPVLVYLDLQATGTTVEAVERELVSGGPSYGYTVQQVTPSGDLTGFELLLTFADPSDEDEHVFYWNLANLQDDQLLAQIALVPEPASLTLLVAAATLKRPRRWR